MVAHLLLKKPEEPVPELIQFLEDRKGTGAKPLSKEERIQLQSLQEEHKKLKEKKSQFFKQDSDSDDDRKGASSSGSEDDEEYLDVVKDEFSPINQQAKLQAAQKSRVSVSAEVFGKYHIKEAFKAQVIEKSHLVQDKIREKLAGAFMFMSLDDKDMQVVINAMDEKHVKNKETIITEGEPGDVLYIVESGSYSCNKVI